MPEEKNSRILILGGWDDDLPGEEEQHDNYDWVVRINSHWLRQGGRIDVLYHCASPKAPFHYLTSVDDFRRQISSVSGAGWSGEWPNIQRFCDTNGVFTEPYFETHGWYKELFDEVTRRGGAQPLTGLAAIWKYAKLTPGVDVFPRGMNIYRQLSHEERATYYGLKAHAPQAQVGVLAQLECECPNLHLSEALKESINFYREELKNGSM